MDYSTQYDEIAEKYDELFQDDYSLKENEEVGEMLSPLKGSVYEIGCGTGLFIELCGVAPNMYVGIDPSRKMLMKFMDKHKGYCSSLKCVAFSEDGMNFEDYDNVVALFGSSSYLSFHDLCRIALSETKKFLMFYKPDYRPVTYQKTNVSFSHSVFTKKRLEDIFKDCSVTEYHNYLIVSNL